MSDIEKIHKVFVGIGSNIKPETHIKKCVDSLNRYFDDLRLSPIYESFSMGFSGPNFYNLAASFFTHYDLLTLKKKLNEIETLNGRSLGEVKFSSRTLDIDILYYDDVIDKNLNVPRNEITKFDFVLRPLYDLAPSHIHPETKMTHNKMLSDTIYKKMIIKKIGLTLVS